MNVVLVDSGGANIGSVGFALARLGANFELSADPARIRAADRVILPGVGAAAPAMARLRERGLVELLRTLPTPLLGICLGMQLLFESSEEGEVECLGRIEGRVGRMPERAGIRLPHMGWNRVRARQPLAWIDAQAGDDRAYFVHGYAAPVTAACVAVSRHGEDFAAAVQQGNVAGAQFHPERSAALGARLLDRFLRQGTLA